MSKDHISRPDGSAIELLVEGAAGGRLALIHAGFGYGLDLPLLYYARRAARAAGCRCLCVDLRYPVNQSFLALADEAREEYFERDIERIAERLGKEGSPPALAIGKSLGATVIHRLLLRGALADGCRLGLLTPGTEWPAIAETLADGTSPALVIGGTADPLFLAVDRTRLSARSGIDILEVEGADHGLETGDLKRDLATLSSVMARLEAFVAS